MLPTRRRLRRPGEQRLTVGASSGSLPCTPLVLSSAGVITGTPTGVGSSNVTIRVTDNGIPTVTKVFTLDVVLALIISTASPLPSGVPNVPYSQTLNAAGGMAPYNWNRCGIGNLPAGLHCLPEGNSAARRRRQALRISPSAPSIAVRHRRISRRASRSPSSPHCR